MMKFIATLPALALVFAISTTATANDGVSANALADMGLAGMEAMSDEAGLAVRGKGYSGGGYKLPKPSDSEKPWSMAYGTSYAGVGGKVAEAGTQDGFVAEGKYYVSGEHFSEAGMTITETYSVDVHGEPGTVETHTKSIRVYAGGFATASSL